MRNSVVVLVAGVSLFSGCIPELSAVKEPQAGPETPEPPPGELKLDITSVDPAVGALLIEVRSDQPAHQWVQLCVPGGQSSASVPEIGAGDVEVAASSFAEACPLAEGLRPLSVSDIASASVPAGGNVSASLALSEVAAGDDDGTLFQAQCPVGQSTCTMRDGSLRCTDLGRDRANCGRCGLACTRMQRCERGLCTGGATCPAGRSFCTGADGARRCVDLTSDKNNCGRCGNACSRLESCRNGACVSPNPCTGGQTQCTAADGSRRCVDTRTDPVNCGRCGNACSRTQSCRNGACVTTPNTCTGGLTQCTAADGSRRCVDTRSDAAHCGTCGNACSRTQSCRNGACVTTTPNPCTGGLTQCTAADGTRRCVDTRTDRANCGTCGNACSRLQSCRNGACVDPNPCPGGQTLCNAPDGTRRCVDTRIDPSNCGTCGNSCLRTQMCTNGACITPNPCTPGQTLCNAPDGRPRCVDTRIDPTNCGTCGNSCARPQTCTNGACTNPTCAPGTTFCTIFDGSQRCVDTRSDPFNCGTCGNVCPVTQRSCRNGICT